MIAYGDAFEAPYLLDVSNDGHWVTGMGQKGLDALYDLADVLIEGGVKAKRPFTIDPYPMDYENIEYTEEEKKENASLYCHQERWDKEVVKLGLRDGSKKSFSCTCYLPEVGNRPKFGDVLAWAESSAVVYANSVIGARCNRNSGPIEMLCSIAGKTPYFGFLTDEARQATWHIEIKTSKLPTATLLGSAIGMKVGAEVPYITGLDQFLGTYLSEAVDDYLKDFGAVLGVKVRENYRFGREKSGKVAYYRATKGVLLAAGGFSQNVQMRMEHDPRLNEKFGSTNHPGATGEALQAAQMIGANTIQMDWIQLGPWTSPDENGFGLAPLFVEPAVGYGLMIDPATGKRFIQETGNRKVRADAIVAIGHPTLIYVSEKNAQNKIIGKNMTPELFDRAVKSGVVKKVANLKELADTYKVPYDELKKTNEKFDSYIKAQKDPDFNCMMFKDAVPNGDGPYYVCRLWPRVHHCMGGLVINNKAQVENARGQVIPGLYAAGEITGGVHGMVRLGTVAVADCIIFGRTAARTAAGK